MLLKRVGLTLLLLTISLCGEKVCAALPETVFLKRTVTVGDGQRGYRVYIPQNFDPKKKYPVVLFLHGAIKIFRKDAAGAIYNQSRDY